MTPLQNLCPFRKVSNGRCLKRNVAGARPRKHRRLTFERITDDELLLAKTAFGLGHGDANALVHFVRESDGAHAAEGKSQDTLLDELYAGSKAPLRPIHEAIMERIAPLGEFEIAPKKGYLSLRRKKQFAMIGPATNTRIEVGINHKTLAGTDRLLAQPDGGMCTHKIKLTAVSDIDEELLAWIRAAYESAG